MTPLFATILCCVRVFTPQRIGVNNGGLVTLFLFVAAVSFWTACLKMARQFLNILQDYLPQQVAKSCELAINFCHFFNFVGTSCLVAAAFTAERDTQLVLLRVQYVLLGLLVLVFSHGALLPLGRQLVAKALLFCPPGSNEAKAAKVIRLCRSLCVCVLFLRSVYSASAPAL